MRVPRWALLVSASVVALAAGAVPAAYAQAEPTNCAARPSACGYPDATNTGVPAGVRLTVHRGDLHITRPGTIVDAMDIQGCVTVEVPNVTIKRSRITCASWYPIRNFYASYNGSNLLVEDVEVDCRNQAGKAVAFNGYHARRINVHHCSDGFYVGDNAFVEDSYIHDLTDGPDGSWHTDGIQSDGGTNVVLRHNTIFNPKAQTAAILMSTNTAPISDVRVERNLMAGGGYILYCGTPSGVTGNMRVTDNRFSRLYFPRGGYHGPATHCEQVTAWRGNIWDDTLAELPN